MLFVYEFCLKGEHVRSNNLNEKLKTTYDPFIFVWLEQIDSGKTLVRSQ